jgi:hypothetical protein
MRNLVRLALCAAVISAIGCGSDGTTQATQRLNLISVDGHALPASIYNVGGDAGSVVGGYVDGAPGQSACGFRLSLHRQGTNGTGTSDAVGGATCTWTGSGNASAVIDLGNNPPWGSHTYTFVP